MVYSRNNGSFITLRSHQSYENTERNREASSAARLLGHLVTWFRLPCYTARHPVTIREINHYLKGKGKQRLKVIWNKEPEEWQKGIIDALKWNPTTNRESYDLVVINGDLGKAERAQWFRLTAPDGYILMYSSKFENPEELISQMRHVGFKRISSRRACDPFGRAAERSLIPNWMSSGSIIVAQKG
ncbi:hypothetical protein MGU_11594 [Metarhizium guizhouense ARSEF 977]|uniref:Uncharacterized protein n=1 Tax=Metarhizium guizhouense (strain ARSEF 977) TaxID=1276136 RepID=A0A0B4G392_METGA|nr:hypothetical protein MGU_11594 [Metarhizium guizhouense ARSEF 977]